MTSKDIWAAGATCGACRFFHSTRPEFCRGECRRHAPRPSNSESWFWPMRLTADDWCGEFEPADRGTPAAARPRKGGVG